MSTNGTALREKVNFIPNQPVRLALKYAQPKIGKSPQGDDYALFTTTDNKVFFLDCDEARVITGAGILPGQDIDVTMRWSGKRGDPKIYGVSLPSGTAAYGAQANGTFAVPVNPQPTTRQDQPPGGWSQAHIASEEARAVPSTQHPAPSWSSMARSLGPEPETKLEWELRTSLELQELKRKLALAEQEKRAAAAPREQPATAPMSPQANSGQPRNVAATNHSTPMQAVNHLAKELVGIYVDVLTWAREEYGTETARPEDIRAMVLSAFINTQKGR